jgi:hypothetical protein
MQRSHEVKDEGYEIEPGGRVVTVFSAPNYCDQFGNKGCYAHFDHTYARQTDATMRSAGHHCDDCPDRLRLLQHTRAKCLLALSSFCLLPSSAS